jgi:ribonuclease P protein component
MLSKTNRIKDKRKFPIILNKGLKFFCPFFLLILEQAEPLKARQNRIPVDKPVNDATNTVEPSGTSYIEFAFITSKKVGGAVKRNHVRRLLSEVISKEIPKIKPDTRAIIIAHNRATTLSFEQMQKEVQTVFAKAGFYL